MELLVVLGGYLIGSFLPAVWVVRKHTGRTPQEVGENPGGAGTWRLIGLKPAAFVVAFDILKGALPVVAAQRLGMGGYWFVLAAISAVVGHNWSIYHGFRGGRGLAAAIGALLSLAWREMLPACVLGGAALLRRRWVPIVGVVAFPIALTLMVLHSVPQERTIAAVAVILLVLIRQASWISTELKHLVKRGT